MTALTLIFFTIFNSAIMFLGIYNYNIHKNQSAITMIVVSSIIYVLIITLCVYKINLKRKSIVYEIIPSSYGMPIK